MQPVSSFGKRVSLCILPIDDFTGEIYRGNIEILINGISVKTIKKSSGMYIYTGILENKIKISAQACHFKKFEEIVDISHLNPLNPLLHMRLRANENYKFSSTASGIRFIAEDKNGVIANAEIKSYISSMSSFVGILDTDVKKSDKIVKIYDVYDKKLEYSSFRIISEKENQNDEYIILGKKREDGCYELQSELKSDHSDKDKLLDAYITSSNVSGNVLIVFNKLHKAASTLTVEIAAGNASKKMSFDIYESKITDIGNVIFN